MKFFTVLKYTGIALLLAVGLSACDKPGPAETAGKNIDQAVDKAGNKINDAADKVEDSMTDKKK